MLDNSNRSKHTFRIHDSISNRLSFLTNDFFIGNKARARSRRLYELNFQNEYETKTNTHTYTHFTE